ncbi:3-isopropylmalate dehydratase large subunit [Candidatus Dependentiae bacterium]|nr:3-isopropylmalate dehydratase large subunit [Candidatus Dependentiae bacterium]
MGKSIIEKIFQSHTKDDVKAGEIIWLDIDLATARDFGGPNVIKNLKKYYPDAPTPCREDMFMLTFDLVAPANNKKYANNQQICREYSKEYGVKVYDVDAGIGSHLLYDRGIMKPNQTVVGTDSHYNILGAFGAFGQGMGDIDIAYVVKKGRTWFEVPKTVKVNIKGKFEFPLTAKDLTLFILKQIQTKFALGKAIEFYGEVFNDFTMPDRITLCSMVTEMGGIIGFIPFNDKNIQDLKDRIKGDFPEPFLADSDAEYADEITIEIDGMTPQVAAPPYPHNVVDVDELSDLEIDSGFVGSCTNGRFEDFETVYKILEKNSIKDGIVLSMVPATKEVSAKLLETGLFQKLFKKGALISNPSCAGCAEGHIGITGKGQVQISTGNRNFPGKQGEGKTYLASPAIVAASVVTGKITNPKKVMGGVK